MSTEQPPHPAESENVYSLDPDAAPKKKRGRPKKKVVNARGENELILCVKTFMNGIQAEDGDTWLNPAIECKAATGAFKTIPRKGGQRAKSISKGAMFRRMKALGVIPQHLPQSRDAVIGALEYIADTEYISAWAELNDVINTYVPWPEGYDPYHKLISAIGSESLRTNREHYLDMHCAWRHFMMQLKHTVAGNVDKLRYPIVMIPYGRSLSGKSWIVKRIFKTIFGDFFANDTFRLLNDQFRQKRAGALPIILLDEMEKVESTDKAAFKNFVTSETLMCRTIQTDEINDDDRIASLICITNDPPPFGLYDESEGLARRIVPFPCNERKYWQRPDEVNAFTDEDALALITGLNIEDPHTIWEERLTSLTERQKVMRTQSFAEEWLAHNCVPWEGEYDSVKHSNRRWDLAEVVESMAAYKKRMDIKQRISRHKPLVARDLRAAGAEVAKSGNNYALVSHRRRDWSGDI